MLYRHMIVIYDYLKITFENICGQLDCKRVLNEFHCFLSVDVQSHNGVPDFTVEWIQLVW